MTPANPDITAAVKRLTGLYATLNPGNLDQLGAIYDAEASFKDPFNEIQGPVQIRKIFEHMFNALNKPKFTISKCIAQDNHCFLIWDFTFYFKSPKPTMQQTIHGASHVIFNEKGMVSYHRDYWDVAEELYEKFPLLGSLLRWIKRRLAVN
ncbi:nuclear transport factor 2 family protein [Advenella sp. WQ 585]|uniref:Nuclear transport factor 2 family protein n=1 Tax=Advenella mandrilli TaxID=2800330 RepID=A0ABS1E8N3_9BURK|nr:nuclear transport factor 2 family protein [Advenella mandrilli]MBK1780022.1 nuclear transport factor 2 family protein [Advenella mandrilli]